ncbi:MAG: hypothetical protein R2882_15935 [Gemmatimonadales bacterium]
MSLVPLANWMPGDRSFPGYAGELTSWLTGFAIVGGGALVLAILARRAPALWRDGLARGALSLADPAHTSRLLIVSLIALGAYLAIALLTFGGRPLLIDEVVQVLQARMYGEGRLWQPVGADPALTSIMHVVERNGRAFGHFPPGGPAWLLIGELMRAPWIAVPLAGALAVVAWGFVLRRVEPSPSVRGAALLLFALAPFMAFMSGSHMNHVPTLMWLLVGTAGLLSWMETPERRGPPLLTGLAFGLAAATRPADAFGWGLAAGVWLLLRARRDRRLVPGMVLGVLAGLLPLVAAGLVNLETTGSVLRSGYQDLWGPNVGLGFHPAPFGPDHTVGRGIELVNLYLLRLNLYLFESPIPSLTWALAALWLAPRLAAFDRYLAGAAMAVLALYWAYWFDGFYLGPRFVFTAIPFVCLWTARLPGLVRDRLGEGPGFRAVCYGGGIAVLLAIGFGIPYRATLYAHGMTSMRFDLDRAARRAGIDSAVVLVRESWGAQVLARLWALGVSRTDAERAYRNTDLCVLDRTVTDLERAGADSGTIATRPAAAPGRLGPAHRLADRRTRAERLLGGGRCSATALRITEAGGFTSTRPPCSPAIEAGRRS